MIERRKTVTEMRKRGGSDLQYGVGVLARALREGAEDMVTVDSKDAKLTLHLPSEELTQRER